jgi:hypothetical protein
MEPKMRTNIKLAARSLAEMGAAAVVAGYINNHTAHNTRIQKIRNGMFASLAGAVAAEAVRRSAGPKINELTDQAINYVQNMKKES